MANNRDDLIDKLSNDITDEVGNIKDNQENPIVDTFNKALADALTTFNSSIFDDDGFVKKMRDIDIKDKNDKETVKNVLNNIKNDYVSADTLNQSELLLRRDIYNICSQMPEMHDVINVVRDSIIEANVATGEVSRSLIFDNIGEDDALQSTTRDLEEKHELLMAIKNFIVPKGLMNGEMYIQCTPYSKLFAELEAIHDVRNGGEVNRRFRESVPTNIMESFTEVKDLYSEQNLTLLTEAAMPITKVDTNDIENISKDKNNKVSDKVIKEDMTAILKNINVYNGSSILYAENGPEGFKDFLLEEYKKNGLYKKNNEFINFNEAMFNDTVHDAFKTIDQDDINVSDYNEIKGCYIKYLDSLRMVPIRVDRKVIGYYYVTTTMDLQANPVSPHGIVDLSYQNYVRDRNMVDSLTNIIIKSFDKKFLENNVKLKDEIAEIVMAHKFSEGKLSFIFVPEDEVIRIVLNEDENGRGHSIIEPSLFPSRLYLMLTLYNMLYILNNNPTRVHYLRSSGLNKDYKAQIQRTIRKFQQRRITIDDIYSYSGVLNKIGGMGEMFLPAGRSNDKALETDTIPGADQPINTEFLEQQRRQAITGTGVPNLLVINAIDEVDFAKTLEMANTRFISTVSSYKIDFNRGITKLYRKIMKYCTTMTDAEINSFHFKFNTVKQQELNITNDMIQNFNQLVELVMNIYYNKSDMEDENGNASPKQLKLKRKLAERYLPDLDMESLDELIEQVELEAKDDELTNAAKDVEINKEDLKAVEKKPNE